MALTEKDNVKILKPISLTFHYYRYKDGREVMIVSLDNEKTWHPVERLSYPSN